VADKKRNFTKLMLPIIKKSRMELLHIYNKIENYQNKELSIQEEIILNKLFDKYKISNREINSLLLAIKPHPTSLVLAQAAMESGWGSSRFFQTGNNVFGIWSFDNKDDRIKAKFNKKVYLKKYDSLKESVSDYFLILGRVSNYKEFRELRKSTNNSYKLAEKLSNYSQSENYVKKLQIIIRVNKFTQYD
jgi:Bax protein